MNYLSGLRTIAAALAAFRPSKYPGATETRSERHCPPVGRRRDRAWSRLAELCRGRVWLVLLACGGASVSSQSTQQAMNRVGRDASYLIAESRSGICRSSGYSQRTACGNSQRSKRRQRARTEHASVTHNCMALRTACRNTGTRSWTMV